MNTVSSKIALFLMTYKGWAVLEAITQNGYKNLIEIVIVGQDKNIDNDYASEIIRFCKSNHIRWILKKDTPLINCKYALAIAWRWLINLSSETKLLVLHDSLLPKYRGFAPLVNQLINGENYLGVTLLFASKEYDKGEIIDQVKKQINYPIKISSAIDIVTKCYILLTLNVFKNITESATFISRKQKETEATYSLWRNNEDYIIDWTWNANKIKRFIDAVGTPYSGAQSFIYNKKIIIEEAEVVKDVKIINRDVGKVIFINNSKPIIICGKGLLKIIKAKYLHNSESILPLAKFRTRFQ